MMYNWVARAEESLVEALQNGDITEKEFTLALRELYQEVDEIGERD
jgi:uncharacterized membrane protein